MRLTAKTSFKIVFAVLSLSYFVYEVVGIWKDSQWGNEELHEYYDNLEFQGVVTDKANDSKNHFNRTLFIRDMEGKEVKVLENYDRSGFYEYVRPGDSVIKESGLKQVKVFRPEGDTIFTIVLEEFESD